MLARLRTPTAPQVVRFGVVLLGLDVLPSADGLREAKELTGE